jgi:cell division septation protein DedD
VTTPLAPRTPPAPPARTDVTRTPAAAPATAPRAADEAPSATAATNAPQRTASITPPADPAEKAATSGGGFSVQLAVRPSDKEARAAFKELQTKYSGDLDGRSPLIKQADVNGKTVYRIRVGPLGREEANSLCTKLKSSGGQCFVAKD